MIAIVYALVMLAIAIGVGALIIMLATRVGAGFTPKFLSAAIAAVVETIAAGIVSYVVSMVLGGSSLSSLVSLVIVFVAYAAILNALIKRPDGSQMGFGKACIVTLIEIVIEIVLCVVMFLVFGGVLLGALGTMGH
jgi:hypothetical protein